MTVPRSISHYNVLEKLGEGGMGEVYLAEDIILRRKVALKMLPESFAGEEDRMRRFEQEARAASALSHPNIAHVYELGQDGGSRFIAMEYVDGKTLDLLAAAGPVDLVTAVEAGIEISGAIAHAHARGIVHRDIKPSNLVVDRAGRLKILDFGLAKVSSDPSSDPGAPHTRTGAVLGTVKYMSPEQALGRAVDSRTDIFSLGVVLYEIVAGRRPFSGDSTVAILDAILHASPEPLARFRDGVPPELERIVRKCMEKDIRLRYQSADEVRIDLQRLRRELGASEPWLSAGASPELAPVSTGGGGDSSRAPTLGVAGAGSAGGGRRPALRVGLALGVVLIAAVGAFVLLRRSRPLPVAGSPLLGGAVSLAVLPFSGGPGDEYLADGLTESLISDLAQISTLKVISRNSVFRFKSSPDDPRSIAARLGVGAVMTGSVRNADGKLVITVELMNAGDGSVLLSRQYVRPQDDVVTTQMSIAQDMASALRLKLSGEEQRQLSKPPTGDAEAYRLYLKGRSHLNQGAPDQLGLAVDFFQQAIQRDPRYALAYADLAQTHFLLGLYFNDPKVEMPAARQAAQKALELDSFAPDGHLVAGLVALMYDWDYEAARQELTAGTGLAPRALETFTCTAHLFEATGSPGHGRDVIRAALATDPLSIPLNTELGCNSYYEREFEQAVREYREVLEISPDNLVAYWGLGRAYGQLGKFEEAIAQLQKAANGDRTAPIITSELGYALARSGRASEAKAQILALAEAARHGFSDPYLTAIVYLGLNDKDQTFAWLERAYKARSGFLVSVGQEPKWDSVRADPRFEDLARRVGLKPKPV